MSPTSCQTAPPRGRNEIIAIPPPAGQRGLHQDLLRLLHFRTLALALLRGLRRRTFLLGRARPRLRLVHFLGTRLPMPAFEFVTHDRLLSPRRLKASRLSLRVVHQSYARHSTGATLVVFYRNVRSPAVTSNGSAFSEGDSGHDQRSSYAHDGLYA